MDDKTTTVKLADIDPDRAKRFAQRLHRKKDEIEITRKSATIDISASDDSDRTIVARVSTPDRDRDGEVVEPKGIDLANYNANPVLMWAHDYKLPPIGRAMWTKIDDAGLLCKFEFAQTAFADEIYTLYRDGFLKTFSIGFIPVEFDGKTKTHKRASLLEVSAVPVPSNPMALIEASAKGLKICDSLKHDLGLDETSATPVAAESTEASDRSAGEVETKEGADVETKTEPEPVSEPGAVSDPAPETKAEEVPTTPADPLLAAILALNEKIDALTASLSPKAPVSASAENAPATETPAPADADVIDIKPEPDVLAGLDLSPAPATAPVSAPPKAIEAMTEAEIVAAVGKALDGLDLKSTIKEEVGLALDKLRGRVR